MLNHSWVFKPKIFTTISYLLLIIGVCTLISIRNDPKLQPAIILKYVPDFFSHISNFSLTYLLVSSGYFALLSGLPLNRIYILCAIGIIGNFIYEIWIPVLNTPDIIDAWYGVAGVIFGIVFLAIVKRYGLMPAKD